MLYPHLSYRHADGSAGFVRRTSMEYPSGSEVIYGYGTSGSIDDHLNRVKELTYDALSQVEYSYLGQARPVIGKYNEPEVELTYYSSSGTGEAGDQYTGLDRFGRIVDQRWRRTTTDADVERVKYGYNRASNRLWRENTVAGTGHDEHYAYDGLNQVKSLDRGTLNAGKTGIDGTPAWEEDWSYDPTGNWNGSSSAFLTKESGTTTLDQNRTHNQANQITDITESTGASWPTPAHDAAGNMTSAPRPFALGSGFELTWDAWNRLVNVKVFRGPNAAYRYDGLHRRVTKATSSGTRHFYYSDRWQVVEERVDTETVPTQTFLWGLRSVDDLVFRDGYSSGSTSSSAPVIQRLYALHDAMSVRALVDDTGLVLERYGYDGFGKPLYMDASFGSRTSSSYEWETLFHAYRYDLETGLYQVRYRYYHPNLGRWLSRDPIGERGGLNLYAFVGNDPVNGWDWLGLKKCSDEEIQNLLLAYTSCMVKADQRLNEMLAKALSEFEKCDREINDYLDAAQEHAENVCGWVYEREHCKENPGASACRLAFSGCVDAMMWPAERAAQLRRLWCDQRLVRAEVSARRAHDRAAGRCWRNHHPAVRCCNYGK